MLSDFKGLFAVVGLRDVERVDVNSEVSSIVRVKSVLGVNDCSDASGFLSLTKPSEWADIPEAA